VPNNNDDGLQNVLGLMPTLCAQLFGQLIGQVF